MSLNHPNIKVDFSMPDREKRPVQGQKEGDGNKGLHKPAGQIGSLRHGSEAAVFDSKNNTDESWK